ncbi:LOW QUALITY PROTEIN: hypothetical protein HID58_013291 [Brassica napus]|uniref:Uncharacterized protein n=1 Tax=Brassica napus TaxID=3708 RepID=A0ABQ8E3I4_BRANA|nr:LOW QUALITY PROTEIN: hypothetical protein HID58_013291 [Brassica napus]
MDFYKIHRKPTTQGIRQNPQNKPKQTKAHQGSKNNPHQRKQDGNTSSPRVQSIESKKHVLRKDSTAFTKLEIIAGQNTATTGTCREQFHNHKLHQIEAKPPSSPDSFSPESIHRTNSRAHPDSSNHT